MYVLAPMFMVTVSMSPMFVVTVCPLEKLDFRVCYDVDQRFR